jgi:hypothetical protein
MGDESLLSCVSEKGEQMKKFLIWSLLFMTMMIPVAVSADTEKADMEANVIAQTISFSMNFTSLGFGTVIVGTDSADIIFKIVNTGNVPLKVTADVTGPLYVECLRLNGEIAQGWVSPVIPAGGEISISAKIVKPTAEYLGSKIVGTLAFVSEAVIP